MPLKKYLAHYAEWAEQKRQLERALAILESHELDFAIETLAKQLERVKGFMRDMEGVNVTTDQPVYDRT